MAIADKLLQVNQVKQDIKTAIETKGIPMTNVAFTEYANKILEISGGGNGGGWDISYEEYALALYYRFDKLALFPYAWQDSQNSETVLYDIPLMLAAPNQEMGGMTVDIYVGTNDQLEQLYNDCVNNVIPPPVDGRDVYYVNNVATYYAGDMSDVIGFPIPIYNFGNFGADDDSFAIADLTPLGMGLGVALAKVAGVPIPNNNIVIQQGFEFENESGIIIPESVTSIGDSAFRYWSANNQPLIIPNSVTSIGDSAFRNWSANNQPLIIPNSVTSISGYAFSNWQANNQPLVIPDSVTSISGYAFSNWQANNQPLVIPNSVTSIGEYAFYEWSLVPYVEIKAVIPPSISSSNAFDGQNNARIYVPDESLDDYKTATNWVDLASRIFPISEKQ